MVKFYLVTIFVVFTLQHSFSQFIVISGSLCRDNVLHFEDKVNDKTAKRNWDFGDGTTSVDIEPEHAYTDSGTYKVVLAVSTTTDTIFFYEDVYINEPPVVSFIADSSIIFYSSYTRVFIDKSVVYNPVSSYKWNFGDNLPEHIINTDTAVTYKYSNAGSYTVWLQVTDNKGCADSASLVVTVHDRYMVPNVFTPNNDMVNDEFVITSNGNTLFSIEIYSRWGNLVFKRDKQQQIVWDGRMPDGSLVNPGTYYYIINSEDGNIQYEPQKGFITVFH